MSQVEATDADLDPAVATANSRSFKTKRRELSMFSTAYVEMHELRFKKGLRVGPADEEYARSGEQLPSKVVAKCSKFSYCNFAKVCSHDMQIRYCRDCKSIEQGGVSICDHGR